MVVFTCNGCSTVLKRNQVDKHCYSCRRCESLACVDCGKDFWGDDYLQHIKCMTEEEKYCGKDHVSKVFKGEAKQEQWVEQVQAAIEKASSKPKLKGLLVRMKDYPNIPRKKAKFENFIKNSLRVNNPSLVTEIWDLLMEGRAQNGTPVVSNTPVELNKSDSITNGSENVGTVDIKTTEEADVAIAPKNKREKKEERRKKSQKKEKKEKQHIESTEDNCDSKKSKGKKRKRNECDENASEETSVTESVQTLGKKKKKRKQTKDSSILTEESVNDKEIEPEENEEEEEEIAPAAKRKKLKFNWEEVIKSILEQKGELSLKKLKKKVLNEFAAQDAANYNEDNLSAKFDKKVLKTPGVKVYKDRACLKTSR